MSRAKGPAAEIAAALRHDRPLLDFVGKRSSGQALLAERDGIAGALAGLGMTPGKRLLLFLPNCPALLAGMLAGLEGGLDVALADPRGEEAALRHRLEAYCPDAILTADLALPLDRLLRLEDAAPGAEVLVARMAAMLPFPRNILTPLLRGSGLAAIPPLPRFHDLQKYAKAKTEAAETAPSAKLRLPEGEVSLATLLAMARGQGLPARWILGAPLAESRALILLLASLRQGRLALLTPRLDAASLTRLARKCGAQVLPAAAA
ncbi:MAG: AMP-binding protein [Rhodovibrionaceae bacterium]